MRVRQPRAQGSVELRLCQSVRGSELQDLRHAGSLRALFPRSDARNLQVVLTNTAGGVTGGDRFRTRIVAGPKTGVTVTTQAAERAYRAQPGEVGRIDNRLHVQPGARLNWLPQETILFDGCALIRRLSIEMARNSAFLLVEPLVFGRAAMGEAVRRGRLDDRIELRRDGTLCYLDRIKLEGDLQRLLSGPAVAAGAGALATLVYAAPDAEARLETLRDLMPETGGASLLRPDFLVGRILASDSFVLRRSLMPALAYLHDDLTPRPWTI